MSAAFVLLAAAPALATHSWNGYHWATGNRSPSVSGSTSLASVLLAVDDWATPTYITPTYTTSGGADIKVVAKRGNVNWIGMAQIKIDADRHILEGKVTLNTFYETITLDNGSTNASIWEHVLCQELGHVIGLTHDGGETCMNDAFDTLGLYPTSGGHDGAELASIYTHSDGTVEPPPPDEDDGSTCKGKSKKKCGGAGAGQWITIHVFPMPASAIGR